MKFKGLENNSVIRVIGSLFRRHGGADWHINIKLTPTQKKKYFGFSQVPILARRRVLNATEKSRPAGFKNSVTVVHTRFWESVQIKACPIPTVNRQEDAKQWCFVFDVNGTRYFLPQIELARVLFLHTAYLARLSLIHNGLSQEFDIQRTSLLNRVRINILPTSSLPLQTRRDDAHRQQLTWILLDEAARHSFESIATYQLKNGYDNDKYRLWDFQFDPPALAGAELTLRGHYEPDLNAFFVYEIDGISKLPSSCPTHVDIIDPRYSDGKLGQGRSWQARPHAGSEPTIDDEEAPNTDLAEVQIDAPSFKFELARPLSTTRISAGKIRVGGHEKDEKQIESSQNNTIEASTDESSIHGILSPADYSAANVKNDDTDIYTDKFKAFEAMIQHLLNISDCARIYRETRKLPAIYGYSKNLRRDGSPRYLAWHVMKKSNQFYSLVEVDTTDNPSSLSTLLIKHKHVSLNSQKYIGELEKQLIKQSLVWPTHFLTRTLENNYKRISHPKSVPENQGLLNQESIKKWAERVSLDMVD
ncbi:MAG: Tn7-like element transposition protein TnsE [Pseudomonas sp.]|nr:Tn7-like element transposition protein TnsE [Pseudomonas sp.]